jgi:hypothetical protein
MNSLTILFCTLTLKSTADAQLRVSVLLGFFCSQKIVPYLNATVGSLWKMMSSRSQTKSISLHIPVQNFLINVQLGTCETPMFMGNQSG